MTSSLYYRREFNGVNSRKTFISLAPALIILLLLFPHTSFSKDSVKNKGRSWYLVGTVKNAPATIKTGKQSRDNCVNASNPLVEYVLRPERCEGTWEIP